MKKIIFFMMIAGVLSAQTETDVSLTAGYNKFDDPYFLRSGRMFYGIRGGVYQDNGIGFQLGYEKAYGANCQGLNLQRLYINTLKLLPQPNGITPYALATVGHESSNIQEHKPNQMFIGVGAGVKKSFNNNFGGFLEARVLRKLETDDTDVITSMGLSYNFKTRPVSYAPISSQSRFVTKRAVIQTPQPIDSGYTTNTTQIVQEPIYIQEPIEEHVLYTPQKLYYIQVAALASSSPEPYIKKSYRYGIENVDVREVYKRGRDMTIVAVGPYETLREVKRALRKVRRVHRSAFIVRF